MGRIKSTMIKKTARNLAEDAESFNTEFEHNKNTLKAIELPSKSVRNKIAGYITRINIIKKTQKKPKSAPVIVQEE